MNHFSLGPVGPKAVAVFLFAALVVMSAGAFSAETTPPGRNLEPWSYLENFETNELNAWASYPLWQDTAFDPNFHVGKLLADDPNISIVQRVTPYTKVDNYAGAQKRLEAVLVPGAVIGVRYYLKTELKPEFFKVRVASPGGPVDFTVSNPQPNGWQSLTVTAADLAAQNPGVKLQSLRVTGLAFLAKFPEADPQMPIYLGLDDIRFDGARTPDFRFSEPAMHKLEEWRPYIPQKLFARGEKLSIRGEWPVTADVVTVRLASVAGGDKPVLSAKLKKAGGEWRLAPVGLDLPAGLYLGELRALDRGTEVGSTEFTVLIAPAGLAGRHPRLWFDTAGLSAVKARLGEPRFRDVAEGIRRDAAKDREALPLDRFYFDVNIFPKDEPLLGNVPRSIYPWFDRIGDWRAGIHDNALAYALLADQEAGRYAAGLLVRLCAQTPWLHPWFESRGQHIYYPVAELGMDAALGYDLVYDLLDEPGRKTVRDGLWRNVIIGCHRSYVVDDLVTNSTSNWAAHIASGSLLAQAAVFADAADAGTEPYLTGALLKLREVILKTSGRDGGYGESYGYGNFTMLSLSKSLPALANVFQIDLSGTLDRTYQDMPWASLLEDRLFFYFGDSGGSLGPMTNWAWLVPQNRDPLLSWLYQYLKKGETLMDAIYEPEKVPGRSPFDRNPVRVYRDLGTTVFRSGWTKDDFLFVLRTGPFYNHQHLDQGSFWLADRGRVFISERHGSTYYDDPFYQSHYTQPVAHSTILVDGNEQSQRVGDPLAYIPGLEDHAAIEQFLDGESAAFVSGSIGELYWGKVKELKRNVLYLKPRTLLMLDTVVPAENDASVSLLYQGGSMADLTASAGGSTIRKGNDLLRIQHLWPPEAAASVRETPLYLYTLKEEKPLAREGLLALTARTAGRPLVIANLIGTRLPEKAEATPGAGFVHGRSDGRDYAFSTRPGEIYSLGRWKTDALALTWDSRTALAALCTSLESGGDLAIRASAPVSLEVRPGEIRYSVDRPVTLAVRPAVKPGTVLLNGQKTGPSAWDGKSGEVRVSLIPGEGTLTYTTPIKRGQR